MISLEDCVTTLETLKKLSTYYNTDTFKINDLKMIIFSLVAKDPSRVLIYDERMESWLPIMETNNMDFVYKTSQGIMKESLFTAKLSFKPQGHEESST